MTADDLLDTAPERQQVRLRRVCCYIAEGRTADAADALIAAAREEAGGEWAVAAATLAARLIN